jgi:hypothetical protein
MYRQQYADIQLHALNDLQFFGANGSVLPYFGYIEVSVKCPFRDKSFGVPLLVVPDTTYNVRVPVLVGTNILSLLDVSSNDGAETLQIPKPWKLALSSLVSCSNSVLGQVVTNSPITLPPDSRTRVSGYSKGQTVGKIFAMAEAIHGTRLPGDAIVIPTFLKLRGHQKEKVSVSELSLSHY